jgi:hypothetical protein
MRPLLLLALLLPACGGPAFQAGAPAAVEASAPLDPFALMTDAALSSPDSSEVTGASFDSGLSGEAGQRSPAPAPAMDALSAFDSSAVPLDAAAPDAPPDCPDEGCLCVDTTAGYGCPAGFPYVPSRGVCCNWH